MERSNLLVVWQAWIYRIYRCLHLFPGNVSGHDHRQIAAAVAHQYRLLSAGQVLQQLILDGLRGNVMA